MSEAGDRLEAARISSGISPTDLAASCGISLSTYYDLEGFNDLYLTISIAELSPLCKALGIKMVDLFADDSAAFSPEKQSSFEDLAERVRAHLAERRQTLNDFENEVGWEITPFLQNPKAAWNWNIDCLRDVCGGCGVNWISVLPQ